MKHKTPIPKAAFSLMMSAIVYFDKVDEGCGYELLSAKKQIIQDEFNLTNEQIDYLENWSHSKYYNQ
jgi:hypothetical protein